MAPAGTPFGGLSFWLWPFLRAVGIFVRDRLAGLVSLLCFRCPGRPKGRFLGTTMELRGPVARSIVAPFRQVFVKTPPSDRSPSLMSQGAQGPANTGFRTRTPSLLLAGPVPTTPPGSPRVKGSPKAPAPPRRQRRPVYPKAERGQCCTGFGGGDAGRGKRLILLGVGWRCGGRVRWRLWAFVHGHSRFWSRFSEAAIRCAPQTAATVFLPLDSKRIALWRSLQTRQCGSINCWS